MNIYTSVNSIPKGNDVLTDKLTFVFSLCSDPVIRPLNRQLAYSHFDPIGTKKERMPCNNTICHIYYMTRMVSKLVTTHFHAIQIVEGFIIGPLCATILMCVVYTIVKAVKWRRAGRPFSHHSIHELL